MTRFWRPAVAGAVTLAGGLLLAGAAALWQERANAIDAADRFDTLSKRVAQQVTTRLQSYEYGVRGVRGAIAATDGRISRDRFRRYAATRNLKEEFPGARGFGVIWRVSRADEAAFTASARRDGWPGFALRQLEPHADDPFVIQYIEPVERNLAAVGLDIASERNRREAALASMRSGKATLTEPITLVQATGKPAQSFLLLLPIYRAGAIPANPAERDTATIGWSYAPLVIDEVLQGLPNDAGQYTMALRDTQAPDGRAFYASSDGDATAAAGLHRQIAIEIFGRTWEADLQATPAFVQGLGQTRPSRTAAIVGTIGGLCAALAALLAQLAMRSQSERVEQARRAAIVESSDDAIVGTTLDGIVIDWNAGAQRLFGYTARQAVGGNITDLLLPQALAAEELAIRNTAQRGERVRPFESQRRHCSGELIDVSISAAPIMAADGRCVGYSKSFRDIRETKLARLALIELNASLETQVAERTARLDAAMHDLRAIVDAVPSMIGYWDKRLVNRMANKAYSRLFGVDAEQLTGRSMRELLGDTRYEQNLPFAQAALRGEPQTFERDLTNADGSAAGHALAHYHPDVVDGEVRGFYVLVHDVSELVEGRQKLASALRDNEALLRTIHQHAIVSIADRRGRITEVNDAFCAISGYARDALVGQDHRIINSGEHPPEFWLEMWRTVGRGKAWRQEVCNRAKDGSLYWVDSIITPLVDAQGRVEQYISIRFDITAAKRSEQRLRSSEAFLDRAGRLAGVGGWEVDLRTQTIHWSAQTRRIHEVEPDHVPTLATAVDFYAPGVRDRLQRALADATRDGTGWDLELPFVTAKGRAIWVRSVGTAEFEAGQAVRLVGALQDVTERKRAEATLLQERQLMDSLLATLPDQIYFKDRDSRFLRINDALARRYGLDDPALAVGKSDADFFLPEHAARTAALERGIVDSGQPLIDVEEEELWPDRPPTWNLTTKMPLLDIGGQIVGTFGISRDVTTRRQMEAELRGTMTLLNAVLDSATQASIIAVKPDGLVSVFNTGAQQMLGYGADEVLGKLRSMDFHDQQEMRDRAAALSERLGRKIHTGRVLVEPEQLDRPQDWSYRHKDGHIVPVSLAVTAMRDASGELFGYVGIAHDVSRQKSQARQLQHAVEKASKASLAKSQFLANMSHEIRTPMNAVIGLSYVLERTPLNPEQADALGKIKLASKSLLAIINDVLDLSKIEAAEMQIERAPFVLADVLSELTALSRVQADAKGVDFEVQAAEVLPAAVIGDATRLRQVLTNLLSNAIKFTPRGTVRLQVTLLSEHEDQVRLRFDVKDSGIGIAPEAMQRLFTPFAQADTSTTRRFGGTGLGLSIVKQLVTLMGGEVGVNSVPQQGSEFWVELDFPLCGDSVFAELDEAAELMPGPGLSGLRVLVADDSPINLEVARRILELEGAKVWLAHDGQEAVDFLLTRPGAVDLVLMDVQMPVLDGHDATRRIRSGLGLTKLPVIALTAGISTGEHARAAAAGMNDVVAKPFDPPALVRCIRRHVRMDADVAAPARALGEPPSAPGEPPSAPGEAALDWPQIEGIDAADVHTRLGGDAALFGALLARLLGEFADLEDAVPVTEPEPLAARLHNLKGSAGTLGARSLQRLSSQAETACQERKLDLATTLVHQLAAELTALKQAATPALQHLQDAAAANEATSTQPLAAQALAELRLQLKAFDLGATARFKLLSPQLRHVLGRDGFSRLRHRIDNLQFAEAAAMLAEVEAS